MLTIQFLFRPRRFYSRTPLSFLPNSFISLLSLLSSNHIHTSQTTHKFTCFINYSYIPRADFSIPFPVPNLMSRFSIAYTSTLKPAVPEPTSSPCFLFIVTLSFAHNILGRKTVLSDRRARHRWGSRLRLAILLS